MSKTYRDKWRHKTKNPPSYLIDGGLFVRSLNPEDPYLVEWNKFWDSIPYKYNKGYGKNPSWYNRLTSSKPKRRQERDLLNLAKKTLPENLDAILWPMSRKPKWWYW